MKLFQNLTSRFREEDFLRISSCPYNAKSPPPPPQAAMFFDGSKFKISQTIFEKGHTRNNLMKLLQILTSGFGEDFLRISSCPYSAKSFPPPTMAAMFFDQNFMNIFLGSPKEQSCKIPSKSDKRFQRRRTLKNFSKSTQ